MIKKNDFVEIEYTGKIKDEDIVFDTTDETLAKEEGIHGQRTKYGPVVICVGQSQLISGLDKDLVGKEVGQEYSVEIKPEDAFGKKSAKLFQLISMAKFKDQDVVPQPGLQINVDDAVGIIKTVSGGRVYVDFNHPIAGRIVTYKYKVNKMIDDDAEKIKGYLSVTLGFETKVSVADGKATIEFATEFPKEVKEELTKKLTDIVPTVKEVTFIAAKKEEAKGEGKEAEEPQKVPEAETDATSK